MMSRTQITIDSEMQRRARERATQLGISFAEYIRRLVARDLVEPAPTADVSSVFGLGDSGGSDVARDEQEMVGDAVASSTKRGR